MSSDSSREESPLTGVGEGEHGHVDNKIKRSLLWRLYTTHFISTWNMRSYEFAVILLFAQAYPNTLLPTSIRGVLTNGATLFLSPAMGRWADRNAARFRTIKMTIVVQRICVVLGCALWMALFLSPLTRLGSDTDAATAKMALVTTLVGLGIVERACAVGNQIIMERDWVPTVAARAERELPRLNAVMRRIDLVSKILAPVFVSATAVRGGPIVLAAVVGVLNLTTVVVELRAAREAWNACWELKVAREVKPVEEGEGVRESWETEAPVDAGEKRALTMYFKSDACLASLSAALQSFSVLSLSGPMTTYLLTRHYSLSLITTARTAISVVEIGSTLMFPPLASLLARHPGVPFLPRDPMAVLGLAGVTLQLALLVPCLTALLTLSPSSYSDEDPAVAFPAATALVFGALGLSRLGHWTHNLAVQQIAQTRVPPRHRAAFAGVEMTFVSGAEIGRWACAAVWSRPSQFFGVAACGLMSVVVVWLLFASWVVFVARKRGSVRL